MNLQKHLLRRLKRTLYHSVYARGLSRNLGLDKADYGVQRTRNIGIIAHIDAGKTTVTERMLYLAGATKTIGDVDSGNTVTDFMDLERERGITIQSAAIFLNWQKHRVNLIDTPGHVDFSLEVERCARVLDGAVTVLDGSAGVQAQTVAVWHQARKFRLPCVFYVNKMDKQGANFSRSVESIRERLFMENAIPVAPPACDKDGRFVGVYDLIQKRFLNCGPGDVAEWEDIAENSKRYDEMMLGREEMLSKLADVDSDFAEWLLAQPSNDGEGFNEKLNASLRRNTLSLGVVPVACGTALRCAASVLPILNMVTSYLPAPNERNQFLSSVFSDDLCALVFKISHDERHGRLSFARIYTGQLKSGSSVYNANRNVSEARVMTFLPYSDILEPVNSVKAGDIAVLTGLESTVTGDTLLGSEGSLKRAKQKMESVKKTPVGEGNAVDSGDTVEDLVEDETELEELGSAALLSGIDTPDPVYFCAIEPPNIGSLHKFEKALHELTIEDPSLRVRSEGEVGQTIIEAMGELHVEVIKDRLRREYGLDVFMGPLQVAYRELIDENIEHTATVDAVLGERKIKHESTVTMEVLSTPKSGIFKKVDVKLRDMEVPFVRPDWLKAVNEGCANALLAGPILGFPVQDVTIVLRTLLTSGGRVNPAIISASSSKCVREALAKVAAHLIEPVMLVEVSMMGQEGRTTLNGVLQEISCRRGSIIKVDSSDEGSRIARVIGRIPVAEIEGLSSAVRSVTSGLGSIHLQSEGYSDVPFESQQIIIEKHKGSRR